MTPEEATLPAPEIVPDPPGPAPLAPVPTIRYRQAPWAPGLIVALLGFAVPLVVGGRWLGIAIDAVVFGMFALSVGMLIRQSHMISLGHAAFHGGAAYTVAITITRWGWDPHLAVLAAISTAAVLAVLVGVFSAKLPGISLAMVTLAFGQGLYLLIIQPSSRALTGGLDGLPVAEGGFLWLDADAVGGDGFWPVAWAGLVVVGVAIMLLRRSRFGRTLEAIRDNEERARFCGIRTWWPRVAMFTISGVVAGLSGAFVALHNAYVAPSTAYWITTAFGLVAALIGGTGTIAGPVVGALLYILAQDRFATSGGATLWLGLAFVIVVVFAPSGLGGLLTRGIARLRGRRQREVAS